MVGHRAPIIDAHGPETWVLDRTMLLFAGIYRLVILAALQTSFVPDEIFQYTEPSQFLLSESTLRTWEWESEHRIRSYVPILPLAATRKALQILGLDSSENMRVLPRLIFTALAIVADYYFLRLCKTAYSSSVEQPDLRLQRHHGYVTHNLASGYLLSAHQYAFMLHTLSWSLSYCLPRTLGNSLETCLLIIGASLLFPPSSAPIYWNTALLRWQYRTESDDDEENGCADGVSSIAIAIMVTSVYIRPTAVLIWAPLMLFKLATVRDPFTTIVTQILPISWLLVVVFVMTDSCIYGQFTVPPLQFYVANVAKGYAAYFGVQPWHWSVTQGLPTVLGPYLLLVVWGLIRRSQSVFVRILAAFALWYGLSLNVISPHMEFRFLLPCLPFLHIFCGGVLRRALLWCYNKKRNKWVAPASKVVLGATLALQVAAVAYLVRYHQCGTEEALALVGRDIRAHHLPPPSCSADGQSGCTSQQVNVFLAAPCFAFPGYAGLHLPLGSLRTGSIAIHTSPCVLRMEPEMYFDHSPQWHLSHMLAQAGDSNASFVVDYILTFDAYLDALNSTLGKSFAQVAVLPHAYFDYDLDDPHPKKTVYVYKRQQLKMHVTYNLFPDAEPIACSTAAAEPIDDTEEAKVWGRDGGVHGSGDDIDQEGSDGHWHRRSSTRATADQTATPLPSPEPTSGHHHTPFRSFVAAGGTIPQLIPVL